MSKYTYGGGRPVKAHTLVAGNTIRDNKSRGRIMIVEETGNQIFIRGYEQADTHIHRFLDPDETVILVTNAQTETTKDGVA